MPHRIHQPTKEQVRAYMAQRETARRPPPAPEEIRRQLNWRLDPPDPDQVLVRFYLIPSTYGQLATQIAIDWLFAPVTMMPLIPPRQ
ncbi:hypothetical protein [Massilia cavernae]|uniref:Uncharacterized protein n=1 Tax=Massilia cavernae TaxID=2320864 RepID=A0A418Y8G4_9BURK|nr:hypothetical protein [Massilia cavernae]RJG27760.1 hypothetical protein D3872_00355 [Massilia cavernae]